MQCCKGHIVRNQENRALKYRVSLRVPSSRESRVGSRLAGRHTTALRCSPNCPSVPPRHFPTVKRVRNHQHWQCNFWWVMLGCSNDDVLETWRCIWLS